MKKITNLMSILLLSISIISCQKAEIATPANDPDALFAKGGAQQTVTAYTTYAGQATGVNATIWNRQNYVVTSTQTILAQTKALLSTGGSETAAVSQASITGVLSADSLYSLTTGGSSVTQSNAFITNLNLTVGGNTITAEKLQATATSKCGTASTKGAQFDALVVNGTSIVVTGAVNQTIYLANGGFIILNEQSTSKKTTTNKVSAMHIVIPNVADISLATVNADVKCN